MILSRKKISKLLNTNNQSNKRFKQRGINKKNGRTFRNKRKDINLRTKSLKHRRSKNKNFLTNYYDNSSSDDEDIKGGAVSDAGPETDVPSQKTQEIDIQLEEDKKSREAKEKKMDDDEDAEPDEIVEYRLKEDTPGLKKFQDYLDVLNKRAEQIGKAYEEASQRLKLFEIIQKELTNKKKANLKQGDKSKQTGDDLKRLGGAIMQLKLMRNKYKMIKDVYKNDTNTANEIKEKVYYEYTEPKSRIKFYSDSIEGFSSYDKRKGVTINFPGTYTANPFFVEDDFAGEDLIKQMKQQVIRRSGWLFENSRPIVEQKTIDALQFYMDKRGDLTLKSDEKDAATKSSEEIQTDIEKRQKRIEKDENEQKDFEENRISQEEAKAKNEGRVVSEIDDKNKADEEQAQTDASEEKLEEMRKNDKDPETTNTPNDIQGGSKSFYGGSDSITQAGLSTIVAQKETNQSDVDITKLQADKELTEVDKKAAAELQTERGKRMIDVERKKDEIKFSDKKKIDKLLFNRIKQDALMQRLRIIKQILSSESYQDVNKFLGEIDSLITEESKITNYNEDFLKKIRSSLKSLYEGIVQFNETNDRKLSEIKNNVDVMVRKISNASNDAITDNEDTDIVDMSGDDDSLVGDTRQDYDIRTYDDETSSMQDSNDGRRQDEREQGSLASRSTNYTRTMRTGSDDSLTNFTLSTTAYNPATASVISDMTPDADRR